MPQAINLFSKMSFLFFAPDEIRASVFAENLASARAVQKAGYTFVDMLPAAGIKAGEKRDILLYRCEINRSLNPPSLKVARLSRSPTSCS